MLISQMNHFLSSHNSVAGLGYFTKAISKEILRPVFDNTEHIHDQLLQFGFPLFHSAEVQGGIFRTEFILRYAALEASQQVLTVTFENNLNLAGIYGIYEDIR